MIRVGIVGAQGRMGQAVAALVKQAPGLELAAGVEVPGHPALGQPFGQAVLGSELGPVLSGLDVVVDFSVVAGLAERAEQAARAGKPYVCGITGLDQSQVASLGVAAERVAVVYAPNFSLGVNVLYRLVAEAARLLGEDYDIEVIETHHRAKRDAPSGTAVKLAELLAHATGREKVTSGRSGLVGAKSRDEIGISSIRTGDVVGEHTVVFGGTGERVELTHRATSRDAFARGVIAAVRFAVGRGPGLYSMADVLTGSSKT